MSQATAEIVGPVLGMLGAALVLVGILPVAGHIIDTRRSETPAPTEPDPVTPTAPIRGWHVATERVTRAAYCPTRRERRTHAGAHRWSGVTPGQRRPHELATIQPVRSHAA